jgi:hypothetical protein
VSWRFKGKTPLWASVLVLLIVVNLAGQIVTSYAIPRWAPVQRDAMHSYRIHFWHGPTYFVQPWVGVYTEYGYYAGFGLLALFFLLLWVNRGQLEKTG